MIDSSDVSTVLPGQTLGVLGGGQLGRMLGIEARQMGYRFHVLDPDPACPAGQVADHLAVHDYADADAARTFARTCNALTFEFENVPAETLRAIAGVRSIDPSPNVLHVSRHRIREKTFLDELGLSVAPFHACTDAADVAAGIERVGLPCILKTAEFGYDGKGQVRIESADQASEAWTSLQTDEAVLEGLVRFDREMSVIVARSRAGGVSTFPLAQNDHANHILDITTAPADVPDAVAKEARAIAESIAEALDLVGVLAVELFCCGERLMVNELAPRPHNSGHYTFDACVTSQFEQQLRSVAGLPLGDPSLVRPAAAMANILGDCWLDEAGESREPNWARALALPGVKLHLYGKAEPRIGRKMGHLTATADRVDEARAKVTRARDLLCRD